MDTIFLRGIRAETLIGWYDWEREAPRPVIIDLEVGLPSARACVSDTLNDTIDYDALVKRLRAELAERDYLLLEALAERIAQLVLGEFGAPWVQVSLEKPGILDNVAQVGVRIERGHRA